MSAALVSQNQAQVKFAAVVSKLEAIASELVKGEVWDEARIQTIAGLRYIYKDFVSADPERLERYIQACSILHYLEELPTDALNDAKVWKGIEDDLVIDAEHFYQGMLEDYDQFSHYLPEG